jgi:hypothetical protein
VDYSPKKIIEVRKSPKRAELNAAEKWIVTLAESCLRKLISEKSVALIISSCATKYLHVENRHDSQGSIPVAPLLSSPSKEGEATSDTLASELRAILAPKMEKYGLELDRIEVQEVRLPQSIQEAIDRVWTATLLPA